MIRTKINVEEKIEGQAIDCPPDPKRIVEGLLKSYSNRGSRT